MMVVYLLNLCLRKTGGGIPIKPCLRKNDGGIPIKPLSEKE